MAEEKKPYHQQVAEKVIEALKNGTAPWIKPWEPGQILSGPINAVTGKPYRGINRVFLEFQQDGHTDPRWCTYKQAQTLGAQVRKGSKGSLVQYWKFHEERILKDQDGKPLLDEHGQKRYSIVELDRPRVFYATVFHASQIENLPPLPKREPRPEWERHQQAETLITAADVRIFHDQADRAFYRPSSDEIHLPPREQFLSPDTYYATVLHELGHATGHESRLNRDIKNPFGSEEYAREELRAELASYMLGADLGIGHDPGQHHAYIASWIKVLEKDPREIIRAAQDAERIKEYVMERGLEHKQAQNHALETGLQPVTMEINRALADVGRWDDSRAAREANKYGSEALQALADGDMKWARELLSLAAEVEAENAVDFGTSFTTSLAQLDALQKTESVEPQSQDNSMLQAEAEPQVATEKTWLQVPYKEKEAAKAAGAKWDRDEKLWYAPAGANLQPLSRWLEQEKASADRISALPPQEEFAQALQQAGLILDGLPVMDGQIHRVPVENGKPGSKDGAYCGFSDGLPNGWYQNHKSGAKGKWIATNHVLRPDHKPALTVEVQEELTKAEQERRLKQQQAEKRAYARWMNAEPAKAHSYLLQKGIQSFHLRRDKRGNLLVPGFDLDTERIQTLQYISPAGGKWFEKDCSKNGAVCMLFPDAGQENENSQIVLMAEGFATGASLVQATGLPVAVAFDAGNLQHAALALLKKFPDASITICADNDHAHPSGINIGVEKAKEAAAAVAGNVIIPELTKSEKARGLTDFNDIHQSRGLWVVRKAVESAMNIEPELAEIER